MTAFGSVVPPHEEQMMTSHLRAQPKLPRRAALTLGLAVALEFQGGHADAKRAWTQTASQVIAMSEAVSRTAVGQPVIRTVGNCKDDGSQGTLRNEIGAAANGATIDLSQLACSTITLGLPIQVAQDTLHLQGPFDHTLTISGGDQFPIFQHTGIGTLDLNNLKITHGYKFSTGLAKGGCIYSAANVTLTNSEVSSCFLVSASAHASGAGIYTAGDLTFISSTITQNHVLELDGADAAHAAGGGAWVGGNLHSKYSAISNNYAYQLNAAIPRGRGGGVYFKGGADIEYSTISENKANYCGAIADFGDAPLKIASSTVSGNYAHERVGGVCGWGGGSVEISNSTVAFNRQNDGWSGAGIDLLSGNVTLESTIVANNIGSVDVSGWIGGTVLGSHSLVTSSDFPLPSGTILSCAKLDRLTDNGGPTQTHALLFGSRAIDQGSNDANLVHDQRGGDRVAGPFADIGAFERQTGAVDERIFADHFENSTDRDCSL